MKFTKKQLRYSNPHWIDKKNKINFTISEVSSGTNYYVTMSGENDFRYNTLWNNISFGTLESAIDYCENFKQN